METIRKRKHLHPGKNQYHFQKERSPHRGQREDMMLKSSEKLKYVEIKVTVSDTVCFLSKNRGQCRSHIKAFVLLAKACLLHVSLWF